MSFPNPLARVAPVALVALAATAARPALAQAPAAPVAAHTVTCPPPAAATTSTTTTSTAYGEVAPFADVVRSVGALTLEDPREPVYGSAPVLVLGDSLGTLVATYRRGAASAPLRVRVEGADLVVRGTTPEGRLAVRLYDVNAEHAPNALVGRWAVGARGGVFRRAAQ
jgi:hypothetical protein